MGVLNSDAGLNIPDFRASENIFQLITQVARTFRRGGVAGEVIIQTALPDNNTIQYAATSRLYRILSRGNRHSRDFSAIPPLRIWQSFSFQGKMHKQTNAAAEHHTRSHYARLPSTFEFNPVVPCGYAKVKDQYRYQFLLRGPACIPSMKP